MKSTKCIQICICDAKEGGAVGDAGHWGFELGAEGCVGLVEVRWGWGVGVFNISIY